MENLNSVAYINKIDTITEIPGADKIELAQVQGWSSIVAKGTHQVGDLVLCITQDAVIPEDLAVKWGVDRYLRKGNRVRTVKLRGVYSECILISSKDANQGYIDMHKKKHDYLNWVLGHDAMNDFGIYKYEPPVIAVQEKNGRKHKYHQNPNFHIYYKFPNQKNTPNMFNEDDDVVITRKIHGTNARYGIVKKTNISLWSKFINFFKRDPWFEYEYVYGSHNVEKGSDSQGFYSTDVWQEIADDYNIKDKLWKYAKAYKEFIGEGVIIYGEIYGPGIQGEKYDYGKKLKEIRFFDIELNGKYESHLDFELVFNHILELPVVEELYKGKWSKDIQDSFVHNQFIEGTKIPHEGIVVKCITGNRQKVSKVINPDYLMFSEKHLVPDSH